MNTDFKEKEKRIWIILSVFICVYLWLHPLVFAQEKNRRNFSWSFESKNDPILQVTNRSGETIGIEVRLLFQDESYRYPEDLEIPSGESGFLRMREAVERIAGRYRDLSQATSGIVEIQFVGDPGQIESTIVNLNPKLGITSGRSGGQRAPVIRSADPQTGPPGGGTLVTIAGENFNEATTVKFDGIPAMRSLQSSEALIAVAPAHSSGEVDIEVSNGKNRSGLRNAFTYAPAGPVVVRLDPDIAAPTGGQVVRIRGRNFQQGTRVIWDRKAIPARVINADEISVTVPPGVRGSIAVEVVNPDSTRFILEDAFRYAGGPRVIAIQPGMGGVEGGYTVTVAGENFDPGCSVLFDGNYGETTYINPRALAAVVPPGESGPIDVSVSSEEGESDTLQSAFLYNEPPAILSVSAYPNPIVRNTTTTITVEANDQEAGMLDYEYRVAQGQGNITGQGRQAIFSSANVTGIVVIQVTVYDQHRAKTQQNLEIYVE